MSMSNTQPIPGIAFVIVGIVVSATSFFVGYKKMLIFFYAGIIMLVIGIIKMLLKKKPKLREGYVQMEPPTRHASTHKKSAFKHAGMEKHYKFCPKCGQLLHKASTYCQSCGSQV